MKHWWFKCPLEQMAASYGPSAFNSVYIKHLVRLSGPLCQGLISEDICSNNLIANIYQALHTRWCTSHT